MNSVEPAETLARFLYHKNHYRSLDRTVRHAAFMPPANKRLSVFRTFELAENEVWKLGDNLRAEAPVGRADIKVLDATETGLTVDADDIPPRHANIVGWPDESSEIKLKAMILAEKATLRLKQNQ